VSEVKSSCLASEDGINPVLFYYNLVFSIQSIFARGPVARAQIGRNTTMSTTLLVTGGSGFIGSNFILRQMRENKSPIVNLDKLTYAGNPSNLEAIADNAQYQFVQGDIGDRDLVRKLLAKHKPIAIVHFAAESHVDRSIRGPDDFIHTNIDGTFALLEEVRAYWNVLSAEDKARFRFLHVSTDEVYGSLGPDDPPFCETTQYAPNSPYAASKAGSDHLVRAYHHTYGLPTLTTNCSNNYGPFQFPEKLIPLMILNARDGKPLPVYGDGKNVRDWLYVEDHCAAVATVLYSGRPGETYNVGGWNEKPNIEIVETICDLVDEMTAGSQGSRRDLITFVKDRPGHDRRYAMDARKIERDLGWKPKETFESGIRKTVRWYLENDEWVRGVTSGSYRQWIETHYSV
jgi:dTDP-glucose 4,6-dehydratase